MVVLAIYQLILKIIRVINNSSKLRKYSHLMMLLNNILKNVSIQLNQESLALLFLKINKDKFRDSVRIY